MHANNSGTANFYNNSKHQYDASLVSIQFVPPWDNCIATCDCKDGGNMIWFWFEYYSRQTMFFFNYPITLSMPKMHKLPKVGN